MLKLRPLPLSQQLEREVELVEQRETPHSAGDGRLSRNHLLHIAQAAPGGRRCKTRVPHSPNPGLLAG